MEMKMGDGSEKGEWIGIREVEWENQGSPIDQEEYGRGVQLL